MGFDTGDSFLKGLEFSNRRKQFAAQLAMRKEEIGIDRERLDLAEREQEEKAENRDEEEIRKSADSEQIREYRQFLMSRDLSNGRSKKLGQSSSSLASLIRQLQGKTPRTAEEEQELKDYKSRFADITGVEFTELPEKPKEQERSFFDSFLRGLMGTSDPSEESNLDQKEINRSTGQRMRFGPNGFENYGR